MYIKIFKQGEVLMSMKDERLELKITVDDPALFEFKKSNDKSYDYDIEGEWELYSVQSLDPENSLDELEDNDIGAIVEVEEDYIEVFLIYNKVKQRFFKIELNDNDILLYFTENDPQKFSKNRSF